MGFELVEVPFVKISVPLFKDVFKLGGSSFSV